MIIIIIILLLYSKCVLKTIRRKIEKDDISRNRNNFGSSEGSCINYQILIFIFFSIPLSFITDVDFVLFFLDSITKYFVVFEHAPWETKVLFCFVLCFKIQ